MVKESKAKVAAREKFIKAHNEWVKENIPSGYVNGKVWKAWDKRLKALDKLVRAK